MENLELQTDQTRWKIERRSLGSRWVDKTELSKDKQQATYATKSQTMIKTSTPMGKEKNAEEKPWQSNLGLGEWTTIKKKPKMLRLWAMTSTPSIKVY
jgi:hypothetical protein